MFGRNKKQELPEEIRRATEALTTAQEIFEQQQPAANYSTSLDWLLGLSDKEYAKMIKVVEIYRKANSDTAKALGIKTEPTSFLPQPDNTETVPQDVNHLSPNSSQPAPASDDFLDDDDDLAAAFLDDEPTPPAAPATPAQPVRVEVKDENDKPADKPKG